MSQTITHRASRQLRFRGRGRSASPIMSAALGFVAGVLFWHTVGFWDFMAETLLVEVRTREQPRVAAIHTAIRAGGGPTHVGTPASASGGPVPGDTSRQSPRPIAGCSTLTLDRRSGETSSEPCPTDFIVVGTANAAAARGDLALNDADERKTPRTSAPTLAPSVSRARPLP